MEKNTFELSDIRTEYQKDPLGIDCMEPRFSWKLRAVSGSRDIVQTAYRVLVGTRQGADDMWDSGRQESCCSTGVSYAGETLKPCTRYHVTVTVWASGHIPGKDADSASNESKWSSESRAEGWFETGFLNPCADAWGGAQWIGAPEKYISARTMGVFVISCSIRIQEGSRRAGIVFGANDERLMDPRKNQYEIAGENYIRYVLDVDRIPATLQIYRVGYAPEDTDKKPFASVPVIPFKGEEKQPVITEENRYDTHQIKVEVIGDCAYAYVDDVLVDAVEKDSYFGKVVEARQLNPLGDNDTTTFPRLCEIGCYVGAGDRADFGALTVRNFRAPCREVARVDAAGTVAGYDQQGRPAEIQRVCDPSRYSLPMLRRDFQVAAKGLAAARLYITARGIYDCRINGRAVTDTWLNPGMSQYDKQIHYQTYDVTRLLKQGENGIGITLASGWWCDSQTYVLRNYNYFGDRESVLARLELTYQDGTKESVVTDPAGWDYYGEGPYRYAGLFQGEHLDGRAYQLYEDFSRPGFHVDGMKKPEAVETDIIGEFAPSFFGSPWPEVDHADTRIVSGFPAPVMEAERLTARSVAEPRSGLFIYDLGQEIAGVPVIRFHGAAGEEAVIRYGEMLYPDLPEYGNLTGTMLTENYRDAESIDRYILRGDADGETYCPKFTFHGFRYIEVSGLKNAPAPDEVQAIQLSSVQGMTGRLETSNMLLNRFIENVKWSMLCNFISIPTDCPQRNERMGWAGDTHVFCRTATYQSDTRLFYYRYLEALRDLQKENGQLPNIAPVGGGFGGITYESAMIFIVWELYQQYGDLWVIREYYDCMKKWMAYMHEQGMPGEVFVGPLADWLAPDETDALSVWNIFYGRDAELMKNMAEVIGKEEDAAYYARIEEQTKQYWNEKFVDPETGKTKDHKGEINDTQCAYALPLAYHMFSEENRERALMHLARKTEEADCTVRTGFFGTGVLNPMLTEAGRVDLAYRLIQQTAYPSWLYPVTQGATTIWERWNSYTVENGFGGNNSMNSFNHYSLGSVLSWIYETVLGIQRDERDPGYHHFILRPAICMQEGVAGSGLETARGGFETAYGRIESSWEKKQDGYCYSCQVPENTTATLILPGKEAMELGSGRYHFSVG